MTKRVIVFRGEGVIEGRWTTVVGLFPEGMEVQEALGRELQRIGEITLEEDEEWSSRVSCLRDNLLASISIQQEDEKPVPYPLSKIRNLIVEVPNDFSHLYVFQLVPKETRIFRKENGKVFYATTAGYTDDPDGKKLPKAMGEWKYLVEMAKPLPEKNSWRPDMVKAIKKAGFFLVDDEEPFPEDPSPLYVFFEKGHPERTGTGLYRIKVVFTTDILGANLPVWFPRDGRYGAYPERVKGQSWDLAAIREKLKTEPFVVDYMHIDVRDEEPRPAWARKRIIFPGDEEAMSAETKRVADPEIGGLVDKMWSMLKK